MRLANDGKSVCNELHTPDNPSHGFGDKSDISILICDISFVRAPLDCVMDVGYVISI